MKETLPGNRIPGAVPANIAMSVCLCMLSAAASAVDLAAVDQVHDAQAEHCDQDEILAIADPLSRFAETFECGDELFDTRFNALDGVGANVGDNLRFSRVPRADKTGLGEWASHVPRRVTGPNAEACTVCHIDPFEDGSGLAGVNVVRDPLHAGSMGSFIQRNTPHLFGAGALQRLAEEISVELQRQLEGARELSCAGGGAPVAVELSAKGVSFGSIRSRCDGNHDISALSGIDPDLVVKPFQWKGNTSTLRRFNRDASHNELGMQAVEITGDNIDGDGDGVAGEMTVGDQTALAIYLAAQPRPVTKLELNGLGILPLTRAEIASIRRGDMIFNQAGCAECHRPVQTIDQPVFSEPSPLAGYGETTFPAGQDSVASGVDPANPVSFDLTRDQPDNVIEVNGTAVHFGAFERTRSGGALVRLYGDLKRHEMGPALAENIDETGVGASTWMTKELWGVGSTPPYLHDGRATTLMEAILEHGGEAQAARDAVLDLTDGERTDMIAFLDNPVLYKVIEEDAEAVNQFPHRKLDRDGRRDHSRERDRR
ncbi:MAG: di-heme oxidoredictase family protein [Acetobacteraceae bacterium]|uniref:di-heme oxidoredictase family protein n=1 Tax=Bradyrhizobium sp. TaxID=376 RepID=UPI003D0A1487